MALSSTEQALPQGIQVRAGSVVADTNEQRDWRISADWPNVIGSPERCMSTILWYDLDQSVKAIDATTIEQETA